MAEQQRRRHHILMVSDFFYPNVGGVENHLYQLSQALISKGHKVVVLTHAYGDCGGVRYLTNGLKVYYVYRRAFFRQCTFPTFLGQWSVMRVICIRERITLVHCHQVCSCMALEGILCARGLGLKTLFTDHSLFGFADLSSIIMNKLLKVMLSDVHAVICVSHTSKENTVLRACVPPSRVAVIPNAVDASEFRPDPNNPVPWPRQPGEPITVIALSRLMYRKGVDLLACVIPWVCHKYPNVQFVIGGDGPKGKLLEAVIAECGLEGRVKLTGAVRHEHVREFLLQGHVFLNASLTEAFCMAILEAACCGLLVVSTAVGGVPEVLPSSAVELAEPSPAGVLEALERALIRVLTIDPMQQYELLKDMYNWNDVADRTLAVYDAVAATGVLSLPGSSSHLGSMDWGLAGQQHPQVKQTQLEEHNSLQKQSDLHLTAQHKQAAIQTELPVLITPSRYNLRPRRNRTVQPGLSNPTTRAVSSMSQRVEDGTMHASNPAAKFQTALHSRLEECSLGCAANFAVQTDLQIPERDDSLLARMARIQQCGAWAGLGWCLVVMIGQLWLVFLDWWKPYDSIDIAPDWPGPALWQ